MQSATSRLSGHPDQACDLVAEAIVDEYLRRDPTSRVRLSVSGGRGVLFIAGDVCSQADFDVSAIVKRTLGSLGVTDDLEAFVSLEPVPSERVSAFKLPAESPITVTGYATNETDEMVPATVMLVRRIAKRLQDKRLNDAEWFWLGPDADITVIAAKTNPSRVIVSLEHGSEPLEKIRERVKTELAPLVEGVEIQVNPAGPCERRGLGVCSGFSGRSSSVYGSRISSRSIIGHDAASAEKAGAWLARSAARKIVKAGHAAALVHATYLPGERTPSMISARDEKGRDCSSLLTRDDMNLDRVMKTWWRTGLNMDAARWGFAGEAGMPWEV